MEAYNFEKEKILFERYWTMYIAFLFKCNLKGTEKYWIPTFEEAKKQGMLEKVHGMRDELTIIDKTTCTTLAKSSPNATHVRYWRQSRGVKYFVHPTLNGEFIPKLTVIHGNI